MSVKFKPLFSINLQYQGMRNSFFLDPFHIQPQSPQSRGHIRLGVVLQRKLRLLVNRKPQPTHQLGNSKFHLQQGEAHPYAVPWTVPERKEAVRGPSVDGLRGEPVRIETGRVRVDVRIVVDRVDRDHYHGALFEGEVRFADFVGLVRYANYVSDGGVLPKGF